MSVSHLTMKCPFCNKGNIEVLHIPSSVKLLKGPWGGSKAAIQRSREGIMVKTEKCPVCGKSQKHIKKALESGTTKEISHEERLKRIKDSGLPTIIESE